jgi:hypothetical protein
MNGTTSVKMTSDQRNDQLLDVLERCMTACEKGAMTGLGAAEGGRLTRLALDCAEICATTARFVARGSSYMNDLLVLCSQICKACETACRKEENCFQECADTCHECHLTCALVAQPS